MSKWGAWLRPPHGGYEGGATNERAHSPGPDDLGFPLASRLGAQAVVMSVQPRCLTATLSSHQSAPRSPHRPPSRQVFAVSCSTRRPPITSAIRTSSVESQKNKHPPSSPLKEGVDPRLSNADSSALQSFWALDDSAGRPEPSLGLCSFRTRRAASQACHLLCRSP